MLHTWLWKIAPADRSAGFLFMSSLTNPRVALTPTHSPLPAIRPRNSFIIRIYHICGKASTYNSCAALSCFSFRAKNRWQVLSHSHRYAKFAFF